MGVFQPQLQVFLTAGELLNCQQEALEGIGQGEQAGVVRLEGSRRHGD